MGYQSIGAPQVQAAQYVNIVPYLGRKCSLNVDGVGWIQRIPLSVFILGGGMHSQPTVHCCDWNGVGFETYPLITVKGVQ